MTGCGFIEVTPDDAVGGFYKGIAAYKEWGPWGYFGVAHWKHDCYPGKHEAEEVGSAVAHEYFAEGKVYDDKSCGDEGEDNAYMNELEVAYLPCDKTEGCEADDHGSSGQTVDSVDDVSCVCHACYGEYGECDGKWQIGEEGVDALDIYSVECITGENDGYGAAYDGSEKAHADSNTFGDVFGQACGKCWNAGYEHVTEEW